MKKKIILTVTAGILFTTGTWGNLSSVNAQEINKDFYTSAIEAIDNDQYRILFNRKDSSNEEEMIKELGTLIYHLIFTNFIPLPGIEFPENSPYLKEFKEATKWWTSNPNKKTLESTFVDPDGGATRKLKAYFLENPKKTNKTAIIAHGYKGESLQYGPWAKIYYDLGYNVLTPDARAHGRSEGNHIGFGWNEKEDYKKWIQNLIKLSGKDTEIVLHGVSMGAGTVMMTSGEELPNNVKKIVADGGYTSVAAEIKHLKPLMAQILTQLEASEYIRYLDKGIIEADRLLQQYQKFNMEQASALNQVKKSKSPILFITTANDTFVPTKMTEELYNAVKDKSGMKLLKIAKGGHIEAIVQDLPLYKKTIGEFVK